MADATSEPAGRPGRNPILDAIIDVIENQADADKIRQATLAARSEMKGLREDVDMTFGTLEPKIKAAVGPFMQKVYQALALYDDGLDIVDSYFVDGQIGTLIRGGETVRRANIQVNDGLFEFRNASLVAMGPTDIPDYNFLYQLYERHKAGMTTRDEFSNAVGRFWTQAQTALRECQQSPQNIERDAILNAYRRHIEAFEPLRTYAQEGRAELLERGIAELRGTFAAVRDIIPAMQMKLRSNSGPTKSPIANFAINMAAELAAGRVADQALRDALDQLRRNFDGVKREFESTVRRHIDSVLVAEEAQQVREALEAESSAISMLYAFFDSREGVLLGMGSQRLKEAVDRLYASHQKFMDIAEHEGKTLCMKCQHYNESNRRTCDRCGARLIMQAETGVASTIMVQDETSEQTYGVPKEVPVYENIERMMRAVNAIDEDRMTAEEFTAEIDWFEELVDKHEKSYTPRPPAKLDGLPTDQREMADKLLEMTDQAEIDFKEAVSNFRDGITLYRAYLDDGSKESLIEGTRLVWAGNTKLHEVNTAMGPLHDHLMSTTGGVG